jgi:hypothetical protein
MMGYVILQAVAVSPAQLLLAGPLILTWITRTSPWSRNSPRDISDAYYPSLLTSINYGVVYTVPLVVWVIGLTYAAIAPLILPFCTLFFALGYFIHKYLLLYVHLPKYETGGMHAPMAVRRCLAGVIVMQLTMMGVLALKYRTSEQINNPSDSDIGSMSTKSFLAILADPPAWSAYAQTVACLLPLLFFTFLLYWWFREGYDKLVNNVPMEVMGKIVRDVNRESAGAGILNGGNGVGVVGVPHGEELSSVVNGNVGLGLASGGSSNAQPQKRTGAKSVFGRGRDHVGILSRNSLVSISGGSPLRGAFFGSSQGGQNQQHQDDDEISRRSFSGGELLSPIYSEPGTTMDVSDPWQNNNDSHSPYHGQPQQAQHDSYFPRPKSPSRPPTLSTSTQSANNNNNISSAISPSRKHPNPRDSFFSMTGAADEASLFEESEGLLANDEDSGNPSDDENGALSGHSSDPEDLVSPYATLEPPSTRVPGILDAAFGSGVIAEGDEVECAFRPPSNGHYDTFETPDLQIYTYNHPALIGRLPVAWLSVGQGGTGTQPRRLKEAREEQVRSQRTLYRRIVGLQRAGVANHVGGGDGDVDGDGVEEEEGAKKPIIAKIRSFFDGMASWAHMQMS